MIKFIFWLNIILLIQFVQVIISHCFFKIKCCVIWNSKYSYFSSSYSISTLIYF